MVTVRFQPRPTFTIKLGSRRARTILTSNLVKRTIETVADFEKADLNVMTKTRGVWILDSGYKSYESVLEQRFSELADRWEQETEKSSFITAMIAHPDYLSIIAMGEQVLRPIFKRMLKKPGFWFAALEAITQQNPIKESSRGKISAVHADWMEWAKINGYVS